MRLHKLSDEEITDRAKLPAWTLTEALFWLCGWKSLGIEYEDALDQYFPRGFKSALQDAKEGNIGKEIQEDGKVVYIDRPKNWLAWAKAEKERKIPIDSGVQKAIEANS